MDGLKAMLVKVTKDENHKIKSAEFIFDGDETIPLEILQFVDPKGFVEKKKQMKIEVLEGLIQNTNEELEDEGYPKPELLAKLEYLKGMLEKIKNNDCLCNDCKARMNMVDLSDNAEHEAKLKDILGSNNIHMN
jgi:hypothetical protein